MEHFFLMIEKHHLENDNQPPRVDSKEAVLQQRLIAPLLLNSDDVSKRSEITDESRNGHMYRMSEYGKTLR